MEVTFQIHFQFLTERIRRDYIIRWKFCLAIKTRLKWLMKFKNSLQKQISVKECLYKEEEELQGNVLNRDNNICYKFWQNLLCSKYKRDLRHFHQIVWRRWQSEKCEVVISNKVVWITVNEEEWNNYNICIKDSRLDTHDKKYAKVMTKKMMIEKVVSIPILFLTCNS